MNAHTFAAGRDPIQTVGVIKSESSPTAEVPPSSTSVAAITTAQGADKLASQWLDEYLRYDFAKRKNATAERDVAPYVTFMITLLGDRPMKDYSSEDLENLNRALCLVPNHGSVPVDHRKSLYARYQYARDYGWDGLEKPSETTIVNRYGSAFNRFYAWLIGKRHLVLTRHKFEIFGDLTLALPRTAFTDLEAQNLFSMVLFIGHAEEDRWASGPFLAQTGIYWSYLFLVVLGLRPSESAQVAPEDFIWLDRVLYLDLRPFDPAQGRVLRSQAKQLKSDNASRLIIVPPLLVDLGLLKLSQTRHQAGEGRLLADIKPKILSGADRDWGSAMAKDWQRRKLVLGLERENVSGYSGRHFHKELLKALGINEENRERMMGHAISSVSRGYGAKEAYDSDITEKILLAETPFLKWLRETLVGAYQRAKAGGTLSTPPESGTSS